MITTYTGIKSDLYSTLITGMNDTYPDMKIYLTNTVDEDYTKDTEFLVASIQDVDSFRLINSNTEAIYLNTGIMTVQVFTEKLKGEKKQEEIINKIVSIFRNYEKENLRTNNIQFVEGFDSGWQKKNVLINFEWDYYYSEV
jgi:hypothetical protein